MTLERGDEDGAYQAAAYGRSPSTRRTPLAQRMVTRLDEVLDVSGRAGDPGRHRRTSLHRGYPTTTPCHPRMTAPCSTESFASAGPETADPVRPDGRPVRQPGRRPAAHDGHAYASGHGRNLPVGGLIELLPAGRAGAVGRAARPGRRRLLPTGARAGRSARTRSRVGRARRRVAIERRRRSSGRSSSAGAHLDDRPGERGRPATRRSVSRRVAAAPRRDARAGHHDRSGRTRAALGAGRRRPGRARHRWRTRATSRPCGRRVAARRPSRRRDRPPPAAITAHRPALGRHRPHRPPPTAPRASPAAPPRRRLVARSATPSGRRTAERRREPPSCRAASRAARRRTTYGSPMTRILVTGGAGYVGSVSVEAFLAAGHEVVVLDDLTTGHRARRPGGRPAPRRHVRGPDGDRPGCWPTSGSRRSSTAPRARWSANRSPTRRSTTATTSRAASPCSRRPGPRGVGRIVFSSTAAVYGIPDATPIPEDAPLRPINPYGETKRTFEGALAWYGRAYGLRSVSLRYFNVAGATDDARRGPRPRDAPHPERPGGGRGRARR